MTTLIKQDVDEVMLLHRKRLVESHDDEVEAYLWGYKNLHKMRPGVKLCEIIRFAEDLLRYRRESNLSEVFQGGRTKVSYFHPEYYQNVGITPRKISA